MATPSSTRWRTACRRSPSCRSCFSRPPSIIRSSKGKSSTMTKREGFSCAIKPGGPTAPEFARPPARPCEFQHGRAPDRASSPSCRVGGRFTAIERSSRPRRREEEAARRLVGTPALPVLAVARHGGVRVRDHLAVLEHVAARRHLDLLLGDRRAVEGVAAPFAGVVRAAFLVDPDVVRGRGRREDERHQGGAEKAPPNSASSHERSPDMYGSGFNAVARQSVALPVGLCPEGARY